LPPVAPTPAPAPLPGGADVEGSLPAEHPRTNALTATTHAAENSTPERTMNTDVGAAHALLQPIPLTSSRSISSRKM